MGKLTETQKKVLSKFEEGKNYNAYTLRASIATLRALADKGCIRCSNSNGIGCMFDPRVSIHWTLTDKGIRVKQDI